MGVRPSPRQRPASRRLGPRSVLAGLAATVLTAGLALCATPVSAAPPPQEPGVTLRVFNVNTPLSTICTLKPGQTPNVDKLMPTINWSAVSDFGFDNYFVAHVLGNINVASAGTYNFRLISDDGSRLFIDDALVINHDGLHGADPKDGSIVLGAGYHSLRIEHFEREGGQQITLQWQPPGASSYVLVPNSVLSTDSGVVRVTAPGVKECETGADSPGDGLPLTGVHPNYTLTNLRPNGFQPQVTGMDFFPDGRMAITTWGGTDNVLGEVWVLGNTTGSTNPSAVTTTRVASGLKEPMGIKIVDGIIYVSEKHRLTELTDTNGDGVIDVYRTVATWPFGNNFHEFAFGLLYQNGFFYLNLSVSIDYGGATTNPQPAPNRGTTISVNRATGAVSYIAGGLRTPHGIGWGPQGEIFVTDNQGGWLPSSKLLHIKQNRFFNHYMNPAGPFESQPVTKPVLWMPQNEIANSPSTPVTLSSGPFAGQMLIADVTYGGIQRAYLEQVNGEYQGALFRLTQGLETGVTRAHPRAGRRDLRRRPRRRRELGPGGQAPVRPAEAHPERAEHVRHPGYAGPVQRLRDRVHPTPVHRHRGDRWLPGTRSSSGATCRRLAYGGPKVDEQTLSVSSATLSADGKKVTLVVNGLQAGKVVYVRSPRPFSSTTGQSLWSTEAWYTLNAIPGQSGGGNLALGKVATADSSCNANEGPAKAVNGSVAGGNLDKWCSLGGTKWLQVDLGSNQSVNRLVVKHAGAGGENAAWNTRDFNLQVSTNATSWTTVATISANTASVTTHDIATVSARYVRLNVTTPASDGNLAARVYELEAYGPAGGGAGPITGIGGKCLDVNDAGTADGTKIQLWTCNGTGAQQWSRVGDTFRALGKCLDVQQRRHRQRNAVQLWTCNGTGSQVWQPQANGSIVNPQSGKVLDAAGVSSADGTQIHIWDYVGGVNQHWTIHGGSGPTRIQLFDGTGLGSWEHTNGAARHLAGLRWLGRGARR